MMEETDQKTVEVEKSAETTLLPDGNGCAFTSGKKIKVAIIGAGFAGLCAARHIFAEGSGMTGIVFEQTSNIGGTWVYSETTGKDRYGAPIHSNLYNDLWTNLPKEVMEFPDFKYKDNDKSYLPSPEVLQYLVDYADEFKLHQHVKLNHIVKCVAPLGKSWSVSAVDLVNNVEHVSVYDAVMICSGLNSIPVYPTIEGLAKFSGKQLHSREFRRVTPYEGKRVLLIGFGPSGVDISLKLRGHAKKVVMSHNKPQAKELKGIILKPEVASLDDKTVNFVDGTSEDVDVIIYCTGYTYNYPFLTRDCGIVVDQCVSPLYKQFINIEHPTMAIFGIPRPIPFQYLINSQVLTFIKILKGEVKLPDQTEMEQDLEEENKIRREKNLRKKDYHRVKTLEECASYFEQLQQLGQIDRIPPVIVKIFYFSFKNLIRDFENFRKTVFKIVDDESFIFIDEDEKKDLIKSVTFDIPKKESVENPEKSKDENLEKETVENTEKENIPESPSITPIITTVQTSYEDEKHTEQSIETQDSQTDINNDVEITEVSSESGMDTLHTDGPITTFIRSSSDSDLAKKSVETIQVKAVIETNHSHEDIKINGNYNEHVKDSHENGIVNIIKNVECHKKDVE